MVTNKKALPIFFIFVLFFYSCEEIFFMEVSQAGPCICKSLFYICKKNRKNKKIGANYSIFWVL